MIKLSIVYSKEFELERIKNTVKRLDWYLSNKISLSSLSFPKNLDINRLKDLSEEEMASAVNEEYDETKFISEAESITQMYGKYEIKLEEFIKNINLPVIPEIKIQLTCYGVGGSYSLPNEIISNITKHYSLGLLKSVLHEIIHLHIQHLIDKYKIGQWEKETLVNSLYEKVFPDIPKKNDIPIDTTKTRKIFEENFPYIEKIISLINE